MMASEIKPYHPEGGTKREQVGRMFDNISPTYDRLNRILSFGIDQAWRRRLIKALAALKPQTVLDVATGTADLAIAAAQATKASILGVDISEGMLAVGRQKVIDQKLATRVELRYGDSEQLYLPNDHFDAATVTFGVRNFEHLERGLAEILRVLKPGGTLLILEFGQPKLPIVKQAYNFYCSTVMPWLGGLLSRDRDAYTYLPRSSAAFPAGEAFLTHLANVGFTSNKATTLTFGVCMFYQAQKPQAK